MNLIQTPIRKTVLLMAGSLALMMNIATCQAEESKAAPALTPAAIEQMDLANKLIALGEARKDPLMLIVAAKLQKSLGMETAGLPKQGMETKTLLETAKKYAAGRKDLMGLADDVAAEKSKDYCKYCTSSDRAYFGIYR